MNKIEVFYKPDLPDPVGHRLMEQIRSIGHYAIDEIRIAQIYLIDAQLSGSDLTDICEQLLVDGVTQSYSTDGGNQRTSGASEIHSVEVRRKPGVMDPVEQSLIKGLYDIGVKANGVKTAKKYLISGYLPDAHLKTIANKILANPTIEDIFFDNSTDAAANYEPQTIDRQATFIKETVNLAGISDKELEEISKKFTLSLNLVEMKAVQDYFAGLGRDPIDVELETIAQTWSEHCVHKTLKGLIDFNGEVIDNLLAETIVKATNDLDKPWCVSVFKDNAGIIEFNDKYNVCFKVETHNHPSAIEPYGGASTGIGGVIRDILGAGLGGKPVLNTDVFCFGPPDLDRDKVPEGALHPKRVMNGVKNGVRDYGNRMGIPTSNGALFFDERYIGNPLVFCGTLGIIPVGKCEKEASVGDLIILLGGRTGRDGIHGVTFASAGLDKDSEMHSSSAVQIGNPITEKKVTDILLEARDKGLYSCVTDCGGGGLSSAIGEMGEETGVEVYLDKVPLKYQGLTYREIWISEAQERMIIAVPPENEDEVISLFAKEDVEATTIGRFTGDKNLRLLFNSETVGMLEMKFLHDGLPRIKRKAVWSAVKREEPDLKKLDEKNQITAGGSARPNYGGDLKKILSSWNVCGKESIIREYDHEVQGTSVLKPLQGIENDGPGDACIIAPVPGIKKGVIVSNGMNPMYGDVNPYHMAASAIDEALRQIIAVGGNLKQTALIDNFCWGDTDKPECLGSLVMAAQACRDYSLQYETPFVSGKDSLYNEFQIKNDDGLTATSISIPASLLISAVAIMPDVAKAVSMDAKEPGNLIYIVGATKPELGGSHYYFVNGFIGNSAPRVDAALGKTTMDCLANASEAGLVRSCHDCSEGGLAVAAAEMSFAGGRGMDICLNDAPTIGEFSTDGEILFSESNSRFIVEVRPENREMFEKRLGSAPFGLIGKIVDNDNFVIRDKNNAQIISENIYDLKEAWQKPLRD